MMSYTVSGQYVRETNISNDSNRSIVITNKYSPLVAGVASYFLPGLGQFYCGDEARGTAFLVGYSVAISTMVVGMVMWYSDIWLGVNNPFGLALVAVGGLSAITIQIWSTVDAVNLAQTKNRAHSKLLNSFNLDLRPNIQRNRFSHNTNYGLSLIATF